MTEPRCAGVDCGRLATHDYHTEKGIKTYHPFVSGPSPKCPKCGLPQRLDKDPPVVACVCTVPGWRQISPSEPGVGPDSQEICAGCGVQHSLHSAYGTCPPFEDASKTFASKIVRAEAVAPEPFSKGYKHRHGEPVSDACGEGKHGECTQDLTKCYCTYRTGHKVMHAYMNPAKMSDKVTEQRVPRNWTNIPSCPLCKSKDRLRFNGKCQELLIKYRAAHEWHWSYWKASLQPAALPSEPAAEPGPPNEELLEKEWIAQGAHQSFKTWLIYEVAKLRVTNHSKEGTQ